MSTSNVGKVKAVKNRARNPQGMEESDSNFSDDAATNSSPDHPRGALGLLN